MLRLLSVLRARKGTEKEGELEGRYSSGHDRVAGGQQRALGVRAAAAAASRRPEGKNRGLGQETQRAHRLVLFSGRAFLSSK